MYEGKEDRTRCYSDVVGVDMLAGKGVDVVHDLEFPLGMDGAFDHVECWSVLEHCRRPWLVAKHLQEAMREGATISLSVPFTWRVHAYPSDYWRFTVECVRLLFPAIQWDRLAYGYDTTVADKIRHEKVLPVRLPRAEVYGFWRKCES